MNKHLPNHQHLVLAIFLIATVLWLTGCAPEGVVAKSPIPTPIGAVAAPLSPLPTPTRADGRPARQLPAYNPKVHVGEITEMTPADTPLRYSVRNEPNQNRVTTLFVRDAETGKEVRLGNDNGETLFGAQSDQYIIWRYNYFGRDKNPALKTGLYAYALGNGAQIVITQTTGFQWYPEIDGDWMVYASVQDQRAAFGNLRAHNLSTGEDLLLGNNVPYYNPYNAQPPSDFYAIQGNKVAWVEAVTGETSKWAIRVHDLTTQTGRTLNVHDIVYPTLLSISDGIVIWWDEFWVGYDLDQDTLFSIPTTPPEWQNLQQSPVGAITMKDGRLYWDLKVNNQVHHFTAPVKRGK